MKSMKLLIGVDDSEESRHAIDVAFEFFGTGVDYTVISIGETRPLFAGAYAAGTFASPTELTAQFDRAEQAARQRAERGADALPTGPAVDADADVGHVGSAICQAADRLDADVIVIGSHDKSAWKRLLDPSTGRYLIDHAPCPVLVVR